ncbi:hypothetical protein NDU88_003000 [Pleurodeles waltl]|uniref:Rx N-terminal domain-containing protein n=1 Tax=Pleurodeles waltl TaxID=8319 RepID=A0AAV7L4Y9_PLEWA|nr:hypothetical protein NDU88_003000 [Pleurodeles waltl]
MVDGREATDGGPPKGDDEPIAKAFMEQLLGVLREDFARLKQEIAAEVEDLKRDAADLGKWVDALDKQCLRGGIRLLQERAHCPQDKNKELQYQKGELKNSLHHSNILTKGLP